MPGGSGGGVNLPDPGEVIFFDGNPGGADFAFELFDFVISSTLGGKGGGSGSLMLNFLSGVAFSPEVTVHPTIKKSSLKVKN